MRGVDEDLMGSRAREISDALAPLSHLTSKRYDELSVYERLSIGCPVIQLVETTASIFIHALSRLYGEHPEGYRDCFERLGSLGLLPTDLASRRQYIPLLTTAYSIPVAILASLASLWPPFI